MGSDRQDQHDARTSERESLTLKAGPGIGSLHTGFNRHEETPIGVILGCAPEKPRPERLEVACIRGHMQEVLLYLHASHPYMLGSESLFISGDFPSFASRELETGGNRFRLFLNGFTGNIRPKAAFEGLERARSKGKRLASAVLNACNHITAFDSNLQLEALSRELRLPFAPLPIGPLALVGISGEPFFEIGQGIKASSPFETRWPLGYANAYCGYIPTGKEYSGGGQEVNASWKYVGQWKMDDPGEERVVEAARQELAAVGSGSVVKGGASEEG